METETIYVQLMDEGTWVARSVTGQKLRPFVYKILSDAYDPVDEEWEFLPGATVRCEDRVSSDSKERYLLAVEQLRA